MSPVPPTLLAQAGAGRRGALAKTWNFVAFQIVWFACVLASAHECEWVGALVGWPLVLLHLATTERRGRQTLLVLAFTLGGACLDRLFVALEALRLHNPLLLGLSPLWMVTLWASFATTQPSSMRWLVDKPLLAVVIGAASGPFVYRGGEKLGALALGPDFWWSAGVLSVAWALVMGLGSWLTRTLLPRDGA